MTPHDWDEGCTPAEARAILEALGVLDHDGSVVVRGTPVGLGLAWCSERGARWHITHVELSHVALMRDGSLSPGGSCKRVPQGGTCPKHRGWCSTMTDAERRANLDSTLHDLFGW